MGEKSKEKKAQEPTKMQTRGIKNSDQEENKKENDKRKTFTC